MTKQEELLNKVVNTFCNTLDIDAMKRKDYSNNDYKISFDEFKQKLKNMGLEYGRCYHENGIGNNNEYPILLIEYDEDGFRIEKQVCKFYYCTGIYGGVYASIIDNDGKTVVQLGRAR